MLENNTRHAPNSMLNYAAEDSTVNIDLTLNNSVSNLVDEEVISPKGLQDILEGRL